MSVSKLPNGRYRAQVWDPTIGKNVSVPNVIGGERSYKTRKAAERAREKARTALTKRNRHGITVAMFRERWLTDKLFAWDKDSTRIHYAERTRRFAVEHGDLNIGMVTDDHVTTWLAMGNASTVPALRAMFNAAASPAAGRLVSSNPFANLGLGRSKGNAQKNPPAESVVWAIIEAARKLSGPYFAAWVQVGAFTGCRPGELDAFKWANIDWDRDRIWVDEQFNVKTSSFTLPKNGLKRWAPLTPQAREALEQLPQMGKFCFVNSKGEHWRHHSRLHHWDRIREQLELADVSLYLATRHFFGAYAVNVLRLESEDVAFLMGHEDGGEQVRRLYGHRDRELALDRGLAAFTAQAGTAHRTAHKGAENAA